MAIGGLVELNVKSKTLHGKFSGNQLRKEDNNGSTIHLGIMVSEKV